MSVRLKCNDENLDKLMNALELQTQESGVGLVFPVTAPFIIGYGILDFTFGIGKRIDRNFGTVNTGIYD